MGYIWKATYKDGSTFSQYDENSREYSYEQIDKSRLESFTLYKEDGATVITLHIDPGQRLIYRRRVEMSPGLSTTLICHLVGWQENINGRNVQSIAYCFEDGRIELAGQFRNNHPWFYAPIIHPEEASIGLSYKE